MKARDLISKEKDDMVAAVQANLLFQSLNMTREEILAKYPINNHNKTETIEEDGDQCTVENGVDGGMNTGKQGGSERGGKNNNNVGSSGSNNSHEHLQMQPFASASHQQ